MTLLITMAVKNGIVMGADSMISYVDQNTNKVIKRSFITKIIEVKQYHMAASFLGLFEVPLINYTRPHKLIDHIFQRFLNTLSLTENVDTVSEKFRDHLNDTVDFSKMNKDFGVHMAGYVSKNGNKEPKVRHVCKSPHDDKDPNQKDPTKFKSNDESCSSPFPPYAMVFNGIYPIANALVNWIRQFYGNDYSVFNPKDMKIDQAISLTKYLINITKGFENYVRASKGVGGNVKIITINEKGKYFSKNQNVKTSKYCLRCRKPCY